MSFTLTLLPSEDDSIDFKLEGPSSELYQVMDDAIAQYGDGFMCGDLRILNYYSMTRGAKAKAEMKCRFLDSKEAMLWKLSLPMD